MSKTIEQYQIKVCTDCLMAVVNDDYTGLQYQFDEQEADEREQQIRQGIRELYQPTNNQTSSVIIGTLGMDDEEEFSINSCDCCGDQLAGTRHIMNRLEVYR